MNDKLQPEITNETQSIPSMEEFEDQINQSFHKVNVGDLIKGTVVGVTDSEATLDLGSYTEGIIKATDYSNDPNFSIRFDVNVGEVITAKVIKEDDGEGNILLSKKQADSILAWNSLNEHMENRTIIKVKIAQAVKGGVITYVEGVRGFIPASQLSISYVENLEDWVNKEIETIVINVDEEKRKLVLSGKQVEQEKAEAAKNEKLEQLQKGMVTKGIVEKIMPYGAFVRLENGLSGLVHISQISTKRLKSPNEVIKEQDEVKVKVLDTKDGKINLSMKAVADTETVSEKLDNTPKEYSTGEQATTGLGDLLKNLKLH